MSYSELLFSVFSEYCISLEELPVRQCRTSEQHLAFRLYAADDACLASQCGIVGNGQMAGYAYLPSYDTMFPYLGGSGDSGLGCHHSVFTDLHIMGYLAQIIYLDTFAYNRSPHLGLVDKPNPSAPMTAFECMMTLSPICIPG